MNTSHDLDRDLERWMEAVAPRRAPERLASVVIERTQPMRPRPVWLARLMEPPMTTAPLLRGGRIAGRPATLFLVALLALALIAGAIAVGSSLVQRPALPLVWTPANIDQPFPAPMRSEPLFGAPLVQPILAPPAEGADQTDKTWLLTDRTGDAGRVQEALADLVSIEFRTWGCWHPDSLCVWFSPVASMTRPFPDPGVEWVAYGAVFDNDGDGRADIRWGLDNQPGDVVRAWREDLHTGDVFQRVGLWPDDNPLWEVEIPWVDADGTSHRGYGKLYSELTAPKGHFYLWSAIIRDGQIVAMDFAPDAGWIDGRPEDDESIWRNRP
jgi:hypothetical protein